jgi:thiopurine S-methyltransferase
MDHHFWMSRWEKNDIGFHMQQAHHALIRYYDRLNLQPCDTVFVPLCGKSVDMIWLREHGLRIIGTELSLIAAEAFFAEHGLQATRKSSESFVHFTADNLKILCGDHFTLRRDDLDGVAAVYDRAALVALSPDSRRRYADHLTQLLPPAGRILLISYDYNQNEISGPPFSVPFPEIDRLFSPGFEIELLGREETLGTHQGLKARGVTKLTEFVCLLTRRSAKR